MKILIPMAGLGKRFVVAGYKTPKPLIEVDGIPMIEHIVNNFSKDDDFVFGINQQHYNLPETHQILDRIAPGSIKVEMPYQKSGPVASVRHMLAEVDDDEAVIVNYCDFSWVWNYKNFLRQIDETNCDGAVMCYHGFHPHLLAEGSYATLDTDGRWMRAIREKHSWHQSKQEDWTSSGSYYFASGKILKHCCEAIEKKESWEINGEHYVSQLFRILDEEQKRVLVFEISTMLQWGTPEDLADYNYWSDYFRTKQLVNQKKTPAKMDVLTLMAGAGSRFSEAGYTVPKPFIKVDDTFMVKQAADELPQGDRYIFVSQKTFAETYKEAEALLKDGFLNSSTIYLEAVTEGQACTALLAKDELTPEKPLLIAACDHSTLIDADKFRETIRNPELDALILTYRNNPAVRHNPQAYGWVEVDSSGKALSVSVKVPLSTTPINDHAIIGAFWFRTTETFTHYAEQMIEENSRINNEFYIDQCMNYLINDGRHVEVFEVDKYASWGTPNDLKTYQYWQNFFNQADFHPYKMEDIKDV